MDKLIITVTVDSTMSYPGNPHCPKPSDTKAVAAEYVRSVEAGAAIVHTHGAYTSDPKIQADGRKLQIPNLEGTLEVIGGIRARCQPVVQMGLASMRFEQKLEVWRRARPDMNSTAFNAHDEYFQPDSAYPPFEIYAVHPVEELRQYAGAANDHGVKLEVESFHTGAFWTMQKVRGEGLLPEPVWTTLFLGWPGGSWTPPTAQALQYLVANLPPRTNWNMSCMTPAVYWPLVTHAIALGGHVRVGMEDCPYLEDGTLAKSNAQLVEKAVRIARELGRAVATPADARPIIGPPVAR
jgi:3-keto-5-aminohexanoate cleavage enzyme